MKKINSILDKFSNALLYLLSFALGIKLLREPDMWWYLRTGEWIIDNGQVPKMDPFSFTFLSTEWINVKWLYEVVVYFFSRIGGAEFSTVFQGFISVLIVFVSFKMFDVLKGKTTAGNSLWILIQVMALFIAEYRMTGRPETLSHLFSLCSILFFLNYLKRDKRWIYGLIPLQILWTNSHEAYGTGMVLSMVYLLSAIGEKFIFKKGELSKELWIGTLGSLLAVAINPRGFKMITHPIEIFGQLGDNQFTTELYSAYSVYYWNQWQSYGFVLLIGIVIICLIALFVIYKKQKIYFFKKIPIAYGIIILLFIYLGFTSHRNIPFFVLAAAPFLSALTIDLIEKTGKSLPKFKFSSVLIFAFLALSYISVVSNQFYKISNSDNRFGIGVFAEFNPIGLSKFMKTIEYSKNHFSDFNTSAYMMWHLKPDYKTFIDLRDLDIYPKEFFRDVTLCNDNPRYFDYFDEQYNFEYAYMNRLTFSMLINSLHQNPKWRIEFADPVAVLFSKHPKKQVTEDIFQSLSTSESLRPGAIISMLMNPLYSIDAVIENEDLMAAYFYRDLGEYDLGMARLKRNIESNKNVYESYCLMAELLDNKSFSNVDSAIASESALKAFEYIKKALAMRNKNALVHKTLGNMYFRRNQAADAMGQYKKAVKLSPDDHLTWAYMADCQNSLSQLNPNNQMVYEKNWFEYMQKAFDNDPSNLIYAYQLGISFCQRNDCEQGSKYLKMLGPMASLSKEENDMIVNCKKKCGVN